MSSYSSEAIAMYLLILFWYVCMSESKWCIELISSCAHGSEWLHGLAFLYSEVYCSCSMSLYCLEYE